MEKEFAELGLNEHILAGVDALGFTRPTPVQAQAIPEILAGWDVLASAQTGTGKTAAFALPVLQLIEPLSRAARERDAAPGKEGDESEENAVEGARFPAVPTCWPIAARGIRPSRLRSTRTATSSRERRLRSQGGGVGTTGRWRLPRLHARLPTCAAAPTSAPTKPKRKRHHGKAAAGSKSGRGCETHPSRQGGMRKPKANAHPFGPFALIVTPTRELAAQIEGVVTTVCEQTGQRAVVVMGGAKFERQIRGLESGCDLLVATPGRLIDLMEHGHVSLKDVHVLVLDEADRMLDMGFWPSVRRIVKECPDERQTLLFSATIPPRSRGRSTPCSRIPS